MLKLNFTLAIRNLLKNKLYSTINIFGLAVGFAGFLAIVVYVQDESNFDEFHIKNERIYRLMVESNGRDLAITPPVWRKYIKEEVTGIENAISVQPISISVIKDNIPFAESKVFATDPAFFEIFDFPLITGSGDETLLSLPTDLVISEAAALKYFGENIAVGEILMIDLFGKREQFLIKAVIDCPASSHLQFDFLLPFELVEKHFHNPSYYENWRVSFAYTYLLAEGDIDQLEVEAQFINFLFRHGGDELKDRFTPGLEPLNSIYLESDLVYDTPPRGSLAQIRTLMGTAIGLLIIALANFINLSTAQSLRRSKEVGLRKVFGSRRKALIFQFLTESVLISYMAMAIAVLLWLMVRPYYNDFTEKQFDIFTLLKLNLLALLLLIPLFSGLLAGLYPALIISGFQPLKSLRNKTAGKTQGQLARKGLVVFQFGAAIVMLISTAVVYQQVQFMGKAEKGFEDEQVIAIPDGGTISSSKLDRDLLKSALSNISEVSQVSASSGYPGDNIGSSRYIPDGYRPEETVSLSSIFADFDFVKTYEIEVIEGRDFSAQLSTDSTAFLINEAAQRLFAQKDADWSFNPIGKQIDFPAEKRKGSVIGVIKDFNFQSLHEEMRPLIITAHSSRIFVLQISMNTTNIEETLSKIEASWRQLFPATPFNYLFVDEAFEQHYRAEKRLGVLFITFSLLSVFIALLGLFSLASFLTQEKAKELSIRKVVGASKGQLFLLLVKKLNILVLLGNVIGIPVAYLLMTQWLEGFAYRIEMPWLMFILSFLISLFVSLFATSYHALKSANQNPARILAQD